jgi:hypothetical protein
MRNVSLFDVLLVGRDGTLAAPLASDESSADLEMVRQLSLRVVHAVIQERPKVH